jgi:hypothetical protein
VEDALDAADRGLGSYEGVSVILRAGRTSSPDFLRIMGDLIVVFPPEV